MKEIIEKLQGLIEELKDDSDTVDLVLSKHDLRLIRDSLIINDVITETSFEILKKYY